MLMTIPQTLTKTWVMLCACCVLVLSMAATAGAQGKIDVATAETMARNGDVLLLDIRTPGEWKNTGVSPLATPLNMRSSSFGTELMSLIDNRRDVPIALICAGGVRSAYLKNVMENAGFTSVYDVTEGMLGSDAGPGWIAAGLPVEAYDASTD